MKPKNREETDTKADDRRDVIHQGSSLSGSVKRENDATRKALHPDQSKEAEHTGMSESGVIARKEESQDVEQVDEDPGERQKRNQNKSKDDPLAA
jgi:hypothetical protein